jgi:alkanesulfonate monooxygenase SsuD/methylene tetrahydromethanopterin reductase-like flavin-dependent oxidoreductase (luciferase family)
MLKLAGALADGTSLGSCGPKMIREHVTPVINEAASAVGRPSPRIQAMVVVAVTDDAEVLREQQRNSNAGYDQLPTYRRALDLEGVASGADLSLLGSWNQIEEGLNEYVAAGVTDLRIMIGASDAETIQRTRDALAHLEIYARFKSVITPPATRTVSFGFAPKLSFHVPAAAHTSSYCNKSGSTNTRSCVL